jgi:error-prone DNA polymerase
MGFYAPAQLVRDAREHGVEVRPADVSVSDWDCSLEKRADVQPALRLGLRMVKGLPEASGRRIVAVRRERAFSNPQDLAERAALDQRALNALAAAGALASLAGNRHRAAWDVAGIEQPGPLLAKATPAEGIPLLEPPGEGENIIADYRSLGLTLGRHPLALLRERMRAHRIQSAADLKAIEHGARVCTAGIVITRQRPSSASGVIFVTLEDETGHVNLIVWARVAEEQRRPLLQAQLLEVHGELQREGEVMHVIAERMVDRSGWLGALRTSARNFH